MNDTLQKAFDFASDLTKQLITLATGILALTIPFAKDVLGGTTQSRSELQTAWILYLLSIFFGLWTLAALTGELEQSTTDAKPSIRGRNVTLPAVLQMLAFAAGTTAVVWLGMKKI